MSEIRASRNAYRYITADAPTEDSTTRVTVYVKTRVFGESSYPSAVLVLLPSPDWSAGFYNMKGRATGSARRMKSLWDGTPADSGKTPPCRYTFS
mmetsp:Transcript_11204/g.34291  ORF Transcript_11204/g.34291 Transcript_11204/m.34291 type:complete len:95 (-) Transcript_11204:238-522(-)